MIVNSQAQGNIESRFIDEKKVPCRSLPAGTISVTHIMQSDNNESDHAVSISLDKSDHKTKHIVTRVDLRNAAVELGTNHDMYF